MTAELQKVIDANGSRPNQERPGKHREPPRKTEEAPRATEKARGSTERPEISFSVTAVLLSPALQAKLNQVVSLPGCKDLRMKTRVPKRGLDSMPGIWALFLAIEFLVKSKQVFRWVICISTNVESLAIVIGRQHVSNFRDNSKTYITVRLNTFNPRNCFKKIINLSAQKGTLNIDREDLNVVSRMVFFHY